MKAKISIIIPIFNVEPYLSECLNSVVHQTLEDLEIICVNDGSTDKSLSIIESYAKRFKNIVVCDKKNAGYGAAINTGLKIANGEWIGIVEPDDYIVNTMYEDLYTLSKADQDIDIVKAGYWDYYDFEIYGYTKIQLGLKTDKNLIFNIQEKPGLLAIHPSVWSCIYKKTFLEKYNICMIEAKGAGWVDNPFSLETLCLAKKIAWLNKPVYFYRQSNLNSSSNLKDCSIPLNRLNDMFDVLDRLHMTNPDITLQLYKRSIHYIHMIEPNAYFGAQHVKMIENLLKRMKIEVVERMNDKEKSTYSKYIKHLQTSYKIKQQLTTLPFYKATKKIYHGLKFLKNNGLKETYKKITHQNKTEEKNRTKKKKTFVLPAKNGLRVMFVPSDNSRTSGAFLSMVVLNRILRQKYNVDSFVVLPNKGTGDSLLIENNIPFTLVNSKDWVLPLNTERNDKCHKMIVDKIKFNTKAVEKLTKIIKEQQVDLVHINTTYSYVGALAALQSNVPFIWHLREFLEEDQSNTLWSREKDNQLIGKANKVVAISKSIQKKYANVIDKDKLVCIFNGIDTDKFYLPQKEIMLDSILKFIFVGGFEYYKGQIEFSMACAQLCRNGFNNFEIHFVGTGKEEVKKVCTDILNKAGLENNVYYHGYQKNVNEFLKDTDISFTCARSEAFGRTTVEAMLSGNLVIGANSAGTSELIRDGETGLLFDFEEGKCDDLYNKILYALNNKEKARIMAQAGRKYMFENMNAERNARDIYELYREVLI